jgi:Flp pilus assembly CpaE family ATPase
VVVAAQRIPSSRTLEPSVMMHMLSQMTRTRAHRGSLKDDPSPTSRRELEMLLSSSRNCATAKVAEEVAFSLKRSSTVRMIIRTLDRMRRGTSLAVSPASRTAEAFGRARVEEG